MKTRRAKLAGAVLAALVTAGGVVAAGNQYGGQVSRSDLFRKFFTWGQNNSYSTNALTLPFNSYDQLWVDANGSTADPAVLIGLTPSTQGMGLNASGLAFTSGGSSGQAFVTWAPNQLFIQNAVAGPTLTWFGTLNNSSTYISNIASGSDAFQAGVNGARVHFGAGASDYASSNGTTVTFAGPVMATAASGAVALSVPLGAYINLDPTNNNSFIRAPSGSIIEVSTNIFRPASDAAIGLGSVANRWSNVFAIAYQLVNTFAFATAPTISSGFGTGPSIVASNGTAAFEVNVGTGGTASAGVIGLPAATTGWVCNCQDITTPSTNVTRMTANGTTSCTVTNSAFGTGLATAWSASDKLWCTAFAL